MEKLTGLGRGGEAVVRRLHRSRTEAPRLGGGESRPYLFTRGPLASARACTFPQASPRVDPAEGLAHSRCSMTICEGRNVILEKKKTGCLDSRAGLLEVTQIFAGGGIRRPHGM